MITQFFKYNAIEKRKIVVNKLRRWSSKYMNEQAVDEGYDSMLDLMIEDSDDTPLQKSQSKAGRVYRKTIRVAIRQIRIDIMDDTRTMPTESELRAELPILTLPE